ncbi:5'-methylthioadenosine/S-adenosylhomocysteine nucleosidase [Actinomyces wuliandei]|uniref:5'-methylthioadenosine/S-adenosylhomocysteine nucleosidase n=1 Tax=Actinomyces wuliandei TaxID=2057743 RepID=UPI001FA9622B|nr:5'-methylthioadenosine/S-adenosylhomocysteine nucleosidase [Actinomyces wuliandei]
MTSAPRPAAAIISVAMPEEAQPFLEALPRLDGATPPTLLGSAETWSLELSATVGPEVTSPLTGPATLGGDAAAPREVILLRSGIGLVAAASALTAALTQVRPQVVISAGTTGGLGTQVEVGDVCASTALAFTDADATAFGYLHGQTPGQPEIFHGAPSLLARLGRVGEPALRAATPSSGQAHMRIGQMLAGSSFVTEANVATVRRVFPSAISTDMESTALAQVAASAGLPFLSVRGVSDLCGPQAGRDFHMGAQEAAARSAAVVLALLG